MKKVFNSIISLDNQIIKNHIVQGEAVLPGLAYVDMLLGLSAQALNIDPNGYCIRRLSVFNSLVVRKQHPLALRFTFERMEPAGGAAYWEVVVEGTDEATEGTPSTLTHYVSAELHESDNRFDKRIDIAAMKKRAARRADVASVYTRARKAGLVHSGVMKVGGKVFFADDECLVEIALKKTDKKSAQGYRYHPALLDGAAMASGLLLSESDENLFLPTYYASIACAQPLGDHCFALLRISEQKHSHVLDMEIFNDEGRQVARLEGIAVVPMRDRTAAAASQRSEIAAGESEHRLISAADSGERYGGLKHKLLKIFGKYLQRDPASIKLTSGFFDLGMESAQLLKALKEMEDAFDITLNPTVLFENSTLRDLMQCLEREYGVSGADEMASVTTPHGIHTVEPGSDHPSSEAAETGGRSVARASGPLNIAIVGVSGRYPQAGNLDEFWRNLSTGKNCITEVPEDRWNWRDYFSEDRSDPGRHYSKWGGFVNDIDKFDPIFFNIAPREAELLDPQVRLVLEQVWLTLEDAGYTRERLHRLNTPDSPHQVGVYVGSMFQEYPLYAAEASMQGEKIGLDSGLSSISAHISYFWDLNGPCMTIDTACSSSLTAIHQACQALHSGQIDAALAGGVNLTLHPNKYLMLSEAQFISTKGHCASFGVGGDGYIPGEGVGMLMLKRLEDAERDGDRIYAVIKGAAINHGGKASGYTVPNPKAQQRVIARAIRESGFAPETISYVEAHGTGTSLGDPIEVKGLSKAFDSHDKHQFCRLGSVKSNIGHCEAAAGVAGVTKVLMQLKHKKIAPSLHSDTLNPHIDFTKTPFSVNQRLCDWECPTVEGKAYPRRAGISSFGAGGANAHIVLEEYTGGVTLGTRVEEARHGDVAILLSAKDRSRLSVQARLLRSFIEETCPQVNSLSDVAYTLQVGREAMEERLGLVVSSVDELKEKLDRFIDGDEHIEKLYRGEVPFADAADSAIDADAQRHEQLERWAHNGNYSKLAELWVAGQVVDWEKIYGAQRPRIVSIPSEPFTRERYWLPTNKYTPSGLTANALGANTLYPLLHCNTSDLTSQRYRTRLTGKEFFLSDHRVGGKRVLPAVACLEMVTEAVRDAIPDDERPAVSLQNVVWLSPVVVGDEAVELQIELLPEEDGSLNFEIYAESNEGGDGETLYCQGAVSLNDASATVSDGQASTQLDELLHRFRPGRVSVDACYQRFEASGITYGAAHRGLDEVFVAGDEVLAKVSLPEVIQDTLEEFILHPALLDSAVQSSIALGLGEGAAADRPALPYALDKLRISGECRETMWAWVRMTGSHGADNGIRKYDIDIFGPDGRTCLTMRGSSTKVVSEPLPFAEAGRGSETLGTLILRPTWGEPGGAFGREVKAALHQLLVCGFSDGFVDELQRHTGDLSVLNLESGRKDFDTGRIGERYELAAAKLFETIKKLLQDGELNRRGGHTLLQLLVPSDGPEQTFSGLMGLLRTASLENPLLAWQVVKVSSNRPAAAVADTVMSMAARSVGTTIQCEDKQCRVRRFEELERIAKAPTYESGHSPWKEGGVYLLSGCAGGLGRIFAREIAAQVSSATLVITGRSDPAAKGENPFAEIESHGVNVVYRAVDVCDRASLDRLVDEVVARYGGIDGVIHAAGVLRDNFIIRKSAEEFARVLQAKVSGLINLDGATAHLSGLDFFVLFSSVSGAIGKVGQADYSAANAFMDSFAAYRGTLCGAGERSGKTLSINWPLWQSDGMTMDEDSAKALREGMGMSAMDAAAGIHAFYRALSYDAEQLMVIAGDLEKISAYFGEHGKYLAPASSISQGEAAKGETRVSTTDGLDAQLLEKTEHYLKQLLSGVIKLPARRIKLNDPLEKYGIDSVMVMRLTTELEKSFGTLSKTLFFEYQSLDEVMGYFIANHRERLIEVLNISAAAPDVSLSQESDEAGVDPEPVMRKRNRKRFAPAAQRGVESYLESPLDIAVIGLSGKYPQAENIAEYWENLREGKDCIEEIPAERWDWRQYYSDDRSLPGKHYSRWGGFISDVDKFDPLFFNISPLEAVRMDPQERLFLEHAWAALEDAGYTREALGGLSDGLMPGQVGVYAGVMFGDYQLFGAEETLRGNPLQVGGSYASIANRVSYFLNLHGPSMTVDTMCSSSLTTLHLACQDLKLGRTRLAIAGGVNVSIHPNKYLGLSTGQFVSSKGACESFGEGGDGYVPGEGVGVVLLKRLSDALRDGDHIYGVIKGSAINHGGKTNGYSVPNPNAQSDVIQRAIKQSQLDPRAITYIEAHGTGTKLGDPIEITGLGKSLPSPNSGYDCWIGSAKSNIGHCESAAGVAGLTKVLLQMRHRQLVPSLHSSRLNPNIDFDNSPFSVNQQLQPWPPAVVEGRRYPRVAGVSSFGAGGSNAHLIIEEYEDKAREDDRAMVGGEPPIEVLFVLSARDGERLRAYARRLIAYIGNADGTVDPRDLAYTFQLGREAMEERLGVIGGSLDELAERLQAYVDGKENIDGLYLGHIKKNREALAIFEADEEFQEAVDKWIARKKFGKLLDLWVKGLSFDWNKLYPGLKPRRISAPTYPFLRERYWVERSRSTEGDRGAAALHDVQRGHLTVLLHRNASTFREQGYLSVFDGSEWFINHSQAYRHPLFSELTCLELVRQAVIDASGIHASSIGVSFRDVNWAGPVVIGPDPVELRVSLLPGAGGKVAFELHDTQAVVAGKPLVYCQGIAAVGDCGGAREVDLNQARSRLKRLNGDDSGLSGGLHTNTVGDTLFGKAMESLYIGENEFLAKLVLPSSLTETKGEYDLHPLFLETTLKLLQAPDIGLGGGDGLRPISLERLDTLGTKPDTVWVHGRISHPHAVEPGGNTQSAEITWCDDQGVACATFAGVACEIPIIDSPEVRAVQHDRPVFLTKQWHERPIERTVGTEDAKVLGKIAVLATAETSALANKLADTLPLEAEVVLPEASSDLPVKSDEEWAKYGGCIDVAGCGWTSTQGLSWLEWVRSLVEKGQRDKLILLGVTQGLESFRQSTTQLGGAERVGLYRMLQSEYARVQSRHIDVEAGTPLEDAVRQITTELFANAREVEVCYREGVRYRSLLTETKAEPTRSKIEFSDQDGERQKALLITGGTRGLGYLCATHFVKHYGVRRLLLTGREALPPMSEWQRYKGDDSATGRKVNNMLALMALGAEVRVVATGESAEGAATHDLASLAEAFGPIYGVIHCAGMMDHDNPAFIRKRIKGVEQVLRPKVSGLNELLSQLQHQPLRFCVLFSSVSSVVPSLSAGQSDYAMANAYMDYVAQSQANGMPLLSIQWPSWRETGMAADETISDAYQRTGLKTLSDREGMQLLDAVLAMDVGPVVLPAIVDEQWRPDRLSDENMVMQPSSVRRDGVEPVSGAVSDSALAPVEAWLFELLSTELKIDRDKLEADVEFADYGVDSVLLAQVSRRINERLAVALDPSVLFQYGTVESLAGYLLANHRADFVKGDAAVTAPVVTKEPPTLPAKRVLNSLVRTTSSRLVAAGEQSAAAQPDIAVVGMSCRFPGADNLQAYWELLSTGRSAVGKIPDSRFGYATPVYAGLLDSIDRFDPAFFLIAREDAEAMDPQALLALEEAMNLFHHAGYSLGEIKGSSTGVYLGARSQVNSQGMEKARNPIMAVGQNYLATNISQFFDLHGPSMVVDTACSSALVGMNLGIRDLLSGEVNAALVGGVSLMSDDFALNIFEERKLLSRDPAFHIFDQRASGLILGEGAGFVLLKTVEQARVDGDHIYAVVKSVAINNDGRTAGPATPNIEAQKAVMQQALRKSGKSAEEISHLEVNGSGSEVTDLLEMKAIASVYGGAEKNAISLGSIKPNIGHPLCAEGIAGFIKLVLMQQHRSSVPFLSAQKPMKHYDFSESAFRFERRPVAWSGDRTVALNCFADGGTNAHVILASWGAENEYQSSRAPLLPPVLNKIELHSASGTARDSGEKVEAAATPKVRSRWKKVDESQARKVRSRWKKVEESQA